MRDERVIKLAHNLLTYSVDLQPGEKVYIEYKGDYTRALLKELIKKTVALGGVPFWFDNDESLQRRLLHGINEEQMKAYGAIHLGLMRQMDAFLSIRGSDNPFDLADLTPDARQWNTVHFMKPVHLEQRVKHTKWAVLRYPNNSMAQLAEQPQEIFEEFYFQVCNLDYSRLSKAMDPLVRLMNDTNEVRLVGPGTHLRFSIKDIPAIKCDGRLNIPDGEIFTAPVRESVEGHITFNAPTMYQGQLFNDISLRFERGRVVEATASEGTEALNKILDTDDGARYVGEFAFGLNPYITTPMKDTLFDEKIRGSVHLALGTCYDQAPNGNSSAIHWDLVLIQTPAHGGGEVFMDEKLVRRDGSFLPEDLLGLNPDAFD